MVRVFLTYFTPKYKVLRANCKPQHTLLCELDSTCKNSAILVKFISAEISEKWFINNCDATGTEGGEGGRAERQ